MLRNKSVDNYVDNCVHNYVDNYVDNQPNRYVAWKSASLLSNSNTVFHTVALEKNINTTYLHRKKKLWISDANG